MRTVIEYCWDGICLQMPEKVLDEFPKGFIYKTWPYKSCGAGGGIQEMLVPEYIFNLTRFLIFDYFNISIRISVACWIHDRDWDGAEAAWDSFERSNERLQNNMEEIIQRRGRNQFIVARALYRAVTYLNAVTMRGKYRFWSLKAAQGREIPPDALRCVNKNMKYIYEKQIQGLL